MPEPQFLEECRAAITGARQLLEALLEAPGPRTLENTLLPFDGLSILLDNAANMALLYVDVHPADTVRNAAEQGLRLVSDFRMELGQDSRVDRAFREVDPETLDAEARRFRELTLRDFRRAGVGCNAATRARLRELSDRELEVGQIFVRNVRKAARSVRLDPAQLDGLPEAYVRDHPADADGKVCISTEWADVRPFLMHARDGAARLAVYCERENLGWPQNGPLLDELLALRQARAELLGFESWADFAAEELMVGSASNLQSFLDTIDTITAGPARSDLEMLLERKRRDEPEASFVGNWEADFYTTLLQRELFDFDPGTLRPYLGFEQTLSGLLQVTERLFGIQYRPVGDAGRWHEDVRILDVEQDGRILGRIHLDLHPRPGKHKGYRTLDLRRGVEAQQLTECALACNFPDDFLEHRDVCILFHEFGHLLHQILGGRQRWLRFSGIATEPDFVEVPSQLLEELAYDAGVLQSFARNAQTGESVPAELIERLLAASRFGRGLTWRGQLIWSSLSLRLHQKPSGALDTTEANYELRRRYGQCRTPEGIHSQLGFLPLNDQGASFYMYLWSLAIVKDLHAKLLEDGLFDSEVARLYRDAVLAPGGAKPAAELIRDFLGRDFSAEPFRAWLEQPLGAVRKPAVPV